MKAALRSFDRGVISTAIHRFELNLSQDRLRASLLSPRFGQAQARRARLQTSVRTLRATTRSKDCMRAARMYRETQKRTPPARSSRNPRVLSCPGVSKHLFDCILPRRKHGFDPRRCHHLHRLSVQAVHVVTAQLRGAVRRGWAQPALIAPSANLVARPSTERVGPSGVSAENAVSTARPTECSRPHA